MLNNRPLNPALSSPAVYSRRRARAARRQTTLPDWVWGAGLGLIVVLFVGGYFFVDRVIGGGGGGDPCDDPLPNLGSSAAIDAAGFAEEDAAMVNVIQVLDQGDTNTAFTVFYSSAVHNFSHNVDPAVREVDEELGKELCSAIYQLEGQLDTLSRPPAAQIAASARLVRELMADSAEALGLPRPGES